jgi:SAM-dependent methyltransferase
MDTNHWADRAQYIYQSHHQTLAGRHLLDNVVARLLRLGDCSGSSRILEVGCAAGTQTIHLRASGHGRAIGLDINTHVLSLAASNARSRGLNSGFLVQGDGHSLPFAQETFDLVFSVGVMEHLPDPLASLVEQRRVLRQGGRVVMAVPNAYCPWWTTAKKWRARLSKKDHFAFPEAFRTYSPKEGARLMSEAGLREVGWMAADAVLPQCPNLLAGLNILLEKAVAKTPLLRHTQAMLYVWGAR